MTKRSTTERVKDLLLWARQHKIAITSMVVGDVSLQLADLALGDAAPRARTDNDRKADMFRLYGGTVLDELHAEPTGAVIEEEDE